MIDRHQIGRYSRSKGKRCELELAHIFQGKGFLDVHRTAQCMGKTGAAGDLEGAPFIHIECKAVEKLNLRDAIEQAVRDSKANNKGHLPTVFHKKARKGWLVTMPIDDWFKLYDRYVKELNNSGDK